MVILILLSLTFTASVDRTTVPVGESFNVSVSIEGEEISGVSDPVAPGIRGIQILGSSRSQSTQINFINGKMTKSTSLTYDYQMIANSEGEFTIPPFTLKYGGKHYETEPIRIIVKKGVPGRNTPPPVYGDREPGTGEFRNVFLDCNISKGSVYPGEGVVVTQYLYTKVNLGDIQLTASPSYENVWVENVESPTRLDFSRSTRNGILYQRALLKKDILFPLGEKDIKINPISINVLVRGDMFSFFGERKEISSEPRTVIVKPFPPGRPAEFIDAIGKLEIRTDMDTSNLKIDSPFPLRLIIKGEGNISLLTPPKFPDTRKLTTYDPESKVSAKVSGNTLKGERTFTYLITPKVSGIIEIPEIKWAYFDIKNETFVTKTLGPWQVRVNPSSGEMAGEGGEAAKVSKDIAYILPVSRKNVSLMPKFFPLYFLPSVLILLISGYYVLEAKKIQGDRGYASMKVIPRELKNGFRKLEKEIAANNPVQFYEDLTRLLLRFIKLKFNMESFGMKKIDIISQLRERNVPAQILHLLQELLERSETVRFTSLKLEKKEMTGDLKTAREVINALY
jgi:hypothetical protein